MYTPGAQLSVLNSHEFLKLLQQHRPWLCPAEAAAYLGVSLRTMEAWRERGIGPAFRRQGKFVRYHIDALDAYTSDQEATERATD